MKIKKQCDCHLADKHFNGDCQYSQYHDYCEHCFEEKEEDHKSFEENIKKMLDDILDPYTGKHKDPEGSINNTLFGDTLFIRKDLLITILWPIIYKLYERGYYEGIEKDKIRRIEPTESEINFMIEQEKKE